MTITFNPTPEEKALRNEVSDLDEKIFVEIIREMNTGFTATGESKLDADERYAISQEYYAISNFSVRRSYEEGLAIKAQLEAFYAKVTALLAGDAVQPAIEAEAVAEVAVPTSAARRSSSNQADVVKAALDAGHDVSYVWWDNYRRVEKKILSFIRFDEANGSRRSVWATPPNGEFRDSGTGLFWWNE